ncbi:MAG: glycerophosphodiester phosphodiesterase family protein [Anaerolineaceae bacterium]
MKLTEHCVGKVVHAIIALMSSTANHKPLIIAHRGDSANAPENTLAAFRLAWENGADGIELDVMLSADQKLVVIHDDTLERTTNGHGQVGNTPYAALRELDAGSWFRPEFKGEPIPLLDEVFAELGGKFLINVELKNYMTPKDQLPELVVALIKKHGLSDSVLLSSFNARNLRRAKSLAPEIRTGLLTLPGLLGLPMRGFWGRRFGADDLHPYYRDVSAKLVQSRHKLGQKVNVWTVDAPDDLRRMQAFGVDMIICNDPAHARQILER